MHQMKQAYIKTSFNTFHNKLDQDEGKPIFSCTRCLVYTTRTQTQSYHCLTNVNVDRSAVFSPVSIYQSDGFISNFTAVGVGVFY